MYTYIYVCTGTCSMPDTLIFTQVCLVDYVWGYVYYENIGKC